MVILINLIAKYEAMVMTLVMAIKEYVDILLLACNLTYKPERLGWVASIDC